MSTITRARSGALAVAATLTTLVVLGAVLVRLGSPGPADYVLTLLASGAVGLAVWFRQRRLWIAVVALVSLVLILGVVGSIVGGSSTVDGTVTPIDR